MNVKDSFSIMTFRMLLSVVSVSIIVPFFDDITDNSFYVTICVFVLGKFIDFIDKIVDRTRKDSFVLYLVGIMVAVMSITLCFYAFLCWGDDGFEVYAINYNVTLMLTALVLGTIDLLDFFCYLGGWLRTKKMLKQI